MKTRNKRKGGAVTESALCLPLILIIISATIELTTTIYMKESLTLAAYEGARVAVTRGATDTQVRQRVTEVLEQRRITVAGSDPLDAIKVAPSAEDADILDPITITVVAPTAGNSASPFGFVRFITPPDMTVSVVMRKEFTIEEEGE